MYDRPDGHGIYRNDLTGTYFCMATKRVPFEREGGDMTDATPVGFLPYAKTAGRKSKDSRFDSDSIKPVIGLVAAGARAIIANANYRRLDPDGVKAAIEAKNAEIKGQLLSLGEKVATTGKKEEKKAAKRWQRLKA